MEKPILIRYGGAFDGEKVPVSDTSLSLVLTKVDEIRI